MNRKLRTVMAIATRLVFRVPLVVCANVAFGLSSLFESVGNGLNHCQKLLKPLSEAPFIFDWNRQLEKLNEKEKHRLLKELRDDFDI